MYAFCLFICSLVQLSAVCFVHLVFLTDEIMIKICVIADYSLLWQLWWNIHIFKASILTELTLLPTRFNQVCLLERSSFDSLAN